MGSKSLMRGWVALLCAVRGRAGSSLSYVLNCSKVSSGETISLSYITENSDLTKAVRKLWLYFFYIVSWIRGTKFTDCTQFNIFTIIIMNIYALVVKPTDKFTDLYSAPEKLK